MIVTFEKTGIIFANGNRAVAVAAPRSVSARDILEALALPKPRAMMLLFGGAAGLDYALTDRLAALLGEGVAPAAAESGALIIDGGTQSGVMAMMGEAVARGGRGCPLLGVVAAGKVTFPGAKMDAGHADKAQLDPNHWHFVLAESDEWGGETATMFELVRALEAAVVALLINGGSIAADEALQSVRHDWPVLAAEGSGRSADEVCAAMRDPTIGASATIKEITRSGHVEIFPVEEPAAGLKRQLQQNLYAG